MSKINMVYILYMYMICTINMYDYIRAYGDMEVQLAFWHPPSPRHAHGILHGDLADGNVLLSSDGCWKGFVCKARMTI